MKNITKQEELVSALWDFAKGLQKSKNMTSSSKNIKGDGFETKMDMAVLHEALHRIAKNFNLEIQPIQ